MVKDKMVEVEVIDVVVAIEAKDGDGGGWWS